MKIAQGTKPCSRRVLSIIPFISDVGEYSTATLGHDVIRGCGVGYCGRKCGIRALDFHFTQRSDLGPDSARRVGHLQMPPTVCGAVRR